MEDKKRDLSCYLCAYFKRAGMTQEQISSLLCYQELKSIIEVQVLVQLRYADAAKPPFCRRLRGFANVQVPSSALIKCT